MPRKIRLACLLLLIAATAAAVQRDAPPAGDWNAQPAYDGRFTLVRLRWQSGMGGFRRGGFNAAWNHDYPRAESHLAQIVKALTAVNVRTDGSLILSLDDPELFKHPIALMWEPGFWNLSDKEAVSFRAWLQKGGFALFEDFDGAQQWAHFEEQMRRVLPEARFVKLDASHRIYHSFFSLKDIDAIVHPMNGMHPSYWGIYEDNDPSKRLMVVANFDNDVPEYWEWSSEGIYPFDASNEAYKLGVNYLVYALTH